MHDASRLEELREIVLAVDLPEGDMIPGKDLEGFLRDIGIKSPKEEVEKILQSDFVSEDNMVNVKECMKALRDTQKFSNFIDKIFMVKLLKSNSSGLIHLVKHYTGCLIFFVVSVTEVCFIYI
eukprot:bmy_15049T0